MMQTLLSIIPNLTNILYAIGAALILAGAAWLKGRSSGASAERNKQRAKDADAYEKHLKEISDAADARNRVQPSDSVQDDKYLRD